MSHDTNTDSFRQLTSTEINRLEVLGNSASDWSLVTVRSEFHGKLLVDGWLRNCVLDGPVQFILGAAVGKILNCVITNSTIETDEVLLKDCGIIKNTYISSGTQVINCGVISSTSLASPLHGKMMNLCVETGERSVPLTVDLTLCEASKLMRDVALLRSYQMKVESSLLVEKDSHHVNFIGKNCRLIQCSRLLDFRIGSDSSIVASQLSCVVVGSAVAVSSSVVVNSILHDHVFIGTFSSISNSIVCHSSHVEEHAKVSHSMIGSYSAISSGECISSLIGPLVAFHHQSLLISACWPEGKGNIGYGSNVGSNHTGKVADQEIIPGEGMFFGLGTVIKFPANFSAAPYCIIGSGVTCLPQRLLFPFSLVNSPSDVGYMGGINELIPGWVLSDSVFTLLRNEQKYATRQTREAVTTSKVFRFDIMSLVLHARDSLVAVRKMESTKQLYLEADIHGIGKNFVKCANVDKGIRTYTDFLTWFSLRTLFYEVASRGVTEVMNDVRDLISNRHSDSDWGFAKLFISKEYSISNLADFKSALRKFLLLHQRLIVKSCVDSKRKDDSRAIQIIGESYSFFHASAESNEVCKSTIDAGEILENSVEALLSSISKY